MKMKLITLIDKASLACEGDANLSKMSGIPVQHISNMRHGQRTISPETVALLCTAMSMSPEESREWLALSIIENPKNSSRAEVLKKAFFAGVCAITISASFHSESANATPLSQGLTESHSVYYVN
ncbi:helix-turn-helix transcriptional regulator [Aquabacterium sp. CECT 9606]|uniref:helix-turn-helix domain-containing protein n=1 Tax=Aquabacterium sp. CECT 9606 TaxID=2845822 RepID=UPI001E30CD78|nr:helix-turn-helix transcriptional regulator [Aquabacterium sp. CECT 9606]